MRPLDFPPPVVRRGVRVDALVIHPATGRREVLAGVIHREDLQGGGAAFGVGLSLATVLVFMMLLRVAGALGEAGAVSPLAAAWIPNMVFAAAGIVLMARVRT